MYPLSSIGKVNSAAASSRILRILSSTGAWSSDPCPLPPTLHRPNTSATWIWIRRENATPDDGRLPSKERLPRHALPPGGLHLDHPQELPVAYAETALVEGAGAGPIGGTGAGRPDDDPSRRRLDERPRPRLVGAHLALKLHRRLSRIEAAILAAQRTRQRGPLVRLGPRLQVPADPRPKA